LYVNRRCTTGGVHRGCVCDLFTSSLFTPSSRHLRALLSDCGRCSFGGLGCCSCRVCVCVCRCRGCCSLSLSLSVCVTC